MAAKKTATKATTKRSDASKAKKTAGTTPAATSGTKKTSAAKKTSTTTTTAAKKTAATKTAAKKAPAKKAATTKAAASKKTASKKTATKKGATKKAAPERLVVREDESPWTAKELKEVRSELETEIERLTAEIASAETDLNEFLKEPIDGAGDDQADAGAKSFEREHELSLVAGARTGLEQNRHALERIDEGTYGICESCGNPIGKLRLQAYPRATLCMSCKSRQERR
ncbi:TraR/DksA C4-type zinc finger protein [Janibacter indicus]|uniref:TraR/DksA C4-type zinc finger protein n=2 Tax=Janibacter indicus TaxID=857417 RepID=A0A1W2AD68_9MICO|nr:TraR/DksA C4-type zinc finger protein [Janibacter indicus]SMC58596.1 transcriptional regulator, TraR/DksA family [Janibacter indicus]